jgi:hypothetical protein
VGYGALHPNDEKSMKIMKTNRNKMVIIGSAFAFCLFMLVSLFFALAIFAKMNLFAA